MRILIYIAITLLPISLLCQTKAITDDGREVLLHENGKWEYAPDREFSCEELIKEVKTADAKGLSSKQNVLIKNDHNNYVEIGLLKSGKTIIFDMKVDGVGRCIAPKDVSIFTFTDGTSLTLEYTSTVSNCESQFTILLGSVFKNEAQLTELNSKLIRTIEIKANNKHVAFNVNQSASKKIKKTLECLR